MLHDNEKAKQFYRGLGATEDPEWQTYRQGVISNVLHPKVAIFFLAFLPQFVDQNTNFGALSFLVLGLLFVTGGTVWCLLVATFAASATQAIRTNKKFSVWLERFTGIIYIALGLNLIRSRVRPV